ncbi:hypothetical protein BXT84_00125 [Sulfobacillus thermotolerans]|uniref:Uncharacterized protein n=1 Tax=Sulfobacillus thermotolerans TaxID=338644 RepID=A0ABN5GW47_9FIRM|nr:hypothetical protein BXT84_00125 [Sulfobacillus thermotolerans]
MHSHPPSGLFRLDGNIQYTHWSVHKFFGILKTAQNIVLVPMRYIAKQCGKMKSIPGFLPSNPPWTSHTMR